MIKTKIPKIRESQINLIGESLFDSAYQEHKNIKNKQNRIDATFKANTFILCTHMGLVQHLVQQNNYCHCRPVQTTC